MKVLGLDCATKTGWALAEDGKVIESGVQDFSKRRGDSNGMMFLRFRRWLEDMIQGQKPGVLCYERAHHRGGAATEIGVNLAGRVQEAAALAGIECSSFHTAEIKKFAVGAGNAGKPEMMEAAAKLLGRPPIDDNEADACFIALLGGREV
jgi:Holliday junction resolvasome RuvABC endonuclease subunit